MEAFIVGCGGHAKSVIELAESRNIRIIGLIGRKTEIGKKILGYDVIGTDNELKTFKKDCKNLIIGIGKIGGDNLRNKIISKLKREKGVYFPKLISPYAKVSKHAKISEGSTVFHNVVVNAGAFVGKFCILNTSSIIEHDSYIDDFCHISTGAIINGNTKLGENCFVGSGSIIREGLVIDSNAIISAGKRVMGYPLRS